MVRFDALDDFIEAVIGVLVDPVWQGHASVEVIAFFKEQKYVCFGLVSSGKCVSGIGFTWHPFEPHSTSDVCTHCMESRSQVLDVSGWREAFVRDARTLTSELWSCSRKL